MLQGKGPVLGDNVNHPSNAMIVQTEPLHCSSIGASRCCIGA